MGRHGRCIFICINRVTKTLFAATLNEYYQLPQIRGHPMFALGLGLGLASPTNACIYNTRVIR